MDEQLSSLIHSMVQVERSGRSPTAAAALRDIKGDFAARRALGHGRLPVVLDQSVAEEYEYRTRAYLEIARRVLKETETPWSPAAAESATQLLFGELATDRQELLEMLQSAAGAQQRVRTDALESSAARMARMINDEIALLVARQDRNRLALEELLGAPRYAAVRATWQKANALLNATPPDLANAAKEAVGAVEALARIVVGEGKLTLGDCIKRLRAAGRVPGGALKGLEELWGIASETPGVRHGGSASDLDVPTARYVVDLSQAALRLLLAADAA
jgi:signal transduction histidine kinase